jgi:glycosyltransferase 2 family protein
MVGSVVPIPIVSWFAQILVLQQTLQRFYEIPAETALACGAGITFVTFLCIIPAGLVWSRFEHISLRQVAEKSEHDAEELSTGAQA